jgi:hypothetical protein
MLRGKRQIMLAPQQDCDKTALISRFLRVGDLEIDVLRNCVARGTTQVYLSLRTYQIFLFLTLQYQKGRGATLEDTNLWLYGTKTRESVANLLSTQVGLIRGALRDAGSIVSIGVNSSPYSPAQYWIDIGHQDAQIYPRVNQQAAE